MDFWFTQTDGILSFNFDGDNTFEAGRAAQACGRFVADDEDEWVDDNPVSCLNCQYRRWLPGGFSCHKPART